LWLKAAALKRSSKMFLSAEKFVYLYCGAIYNVPKM
jgi:hypothetical protein